MGVALGTFIGGSPLRDPRYAGVFGQNAELAWYIEWIEKQTLTDPLTGLWNSGYFKSETARRVSLTNRERAKGMNSSFCLGMGDIDYFGAYNNAFGHQEGDNALQVISIAMVCALRDYDIACRYGGEEFGIILPDTEIEHGAAALERVRDCVYESSLKNLKIPVTVTFGVASYPRDGATAAELIASADKALYDGKGAGRDRVCAARPNFTA